MANVTAADFWKKPQYMAEFGNAVSLDFPALALTGVNATEKAYIGIIPAGTRVQEVRVVTSGTLGALTTIDLGYEPVGTAPTASNNYWFNDVDSTSALNNISVSQPITFENDVKLTLLVNAANVAASPTITVFVKGAVGSGPRPLAQLMGRVAGTVS